MRAHAAAAAVERPVVGLCFEARRALGRVTLWQRCSARTKTQYTQACVVLTATAVVLACEQSKDIEVGPQARNEALCGDAASSVVAADTGGRWFISIAFCALHKAHIPHTFKACTYLYTLDSTPSCLPSYIDSQHKPFVIWGQLNSLSSIAAAAAAAMAIDPTCPKVKNMLLLDSEGKRIAVKYYSPEW